MLDTTLNLPGSPFVSKFRKDYCEAWCSEKDCASLRAVEYSSSVLYYISPPPSQLREYTFGNEEETPPTTFDPAQVARESGAILPGGKCPQPRNVSILMTLTDRKNTMVRCVIIIIAI